MKVFGGASKVSSDSTSRRSAAQAWGRNEILFLIFLLWLTAIAASANSLQKDSKVRQVENGTWGGQHIELEIADDRSTIDFDCAHGSIDQRFQADSTGAFDLSGTYVEESPGPVRKGGREQTHRARYVGRIEGDAMTMTVKLIDTGKTAGSFRLTRGALPGVSKCG